MTSGGVLRRRSLLWSVLKIPEPSGRWLRSSVFSREGNSVNKEQPCHTDITPAIPRIDVNDLLGRGRELIIVHKNAEYRLRLTRNDKLILTK